MKMKNTSMIILFTLSSACHSETTKSFMDLSIGMSLQKVLGENKFSSCIIEEKNPSEDVKLMFSKMHPCEKKYSTTYFCRPSPIFGSTLLNFNSDNSLYRMTFSVSRSSTDNDRKVAFSALEGKLGAPKGIVAFEDFNDEWSINQFNFGGPDCKKYKCTKEFWSSDDDQDKFISFSFEDRLLPGKKLHNLHIVNFKMFKEVESKTSSCLTEANKANAKKLGF